jgi:hypothetical protein
MSLEFFNQLYTSFIHDYETTFPQENNTLDIDSIKIEELYVKYFALISSFYSDKIFFTQSGLSILSSSKMTF